jgi:hypothetical protein
MKMMKTMITLTTIITINKNPKNQRDPIIYEHLKNVKYVLGMVITHKIVFIIL